MFLGRGSGGVRGVTEGQRGSGPVRHLGWEVEGAAGGSLTLVLVGVSGQLGLV